MAVAVALANEPDLLLADEVTGELDSATAEQVMEVIFEAWRERGLSVLYVTHSEELAARAQHRLALADGAVRSAVTTGAPIRIEALSKHYETSAGVVRAVDGVTIEVEPGTSLAVTGPSGCGKSTLLGLIGGLESPSAGSVSLGGHEISSLPERDRERIRRDEVGLRVPGRQPPAVPHGARERRASSSR